MDNALTYWHWGRRDLILINYNMWLNNNPYVPLDTLDMMIQKTVYVLMIIFRPRYDDTHFLIKG